MSSLVSSHSDSAPGVARSDSNRLLPGTRLGEFEIREVLGEGGFGIVYLAFDHSLHRTIAIKEYMPAMLALRHGNQGVHVRSERFIDTFSAGLRSFVNEARMLAQFDHPALIKVYRFWEENGTAYMAMPYYVGHTLKLIRTAQPDRINEVWLTKLLLPLLGALDTLHHINCFHRDIALDNIMVQEDNIPVLLDFGAARKIIGNMVDEMTVMLKPGYAPIEQYTDDRTLKQGAWSDLYALGAVLHTLLVGAPPPSAVVRSIQDEYVPLERRGDLSGYSSRFLKAIDAMLQLRPQDRPQSVEAFSRLMGMRPHVKKPGVYQLEAATAQEIAKQQAASSRHSSALAVKSGPVSSATSSSAQPEVQNVSAGPVPFGSQELSDTVAMHHLSRKNESGTSSPIAQAPLPPVVKRHIPKPVDFEPEEVAMPKESSFSHEKMILLVGSIALCVLVLVGAAMFYFGRHRSLLISEQASAGAFTAVAKPEAGVPASGTVASNHQDGYSNASNNVPAIRSVTPNNQDSEPSSPVIEWTNPRSRNNAETVPSVVVLDTERSTVDERLEEQDWGIAKKTNTSSAYQFYRDVHPDGKHQAEAKRRYTEAKSREEEAAIAAKQPTVIRFNIRPWGDVYIDGRKVGVTPPLKEYKITPGSYQVLIRNNDYSPYYTPITIKKGDQVNITYSFE